MRMSRLVGIGVLGCMLASVGGSAAFAGEYYNTLRCIPAVLNSSRGIAFPSPAPRWSDMHYNWAGQLDNPSSSLAAFRCSVDEPSDTPVSQGSLTGWSAGCNYNFGTTQLYLQACVIPKAGGTGAQCGPIILPRSGANSLDCTAGTKNLSFSFPAHSSGDALELRVYMDGQLGASSAAFWSYQVY